MKRLSRLALAAFFCAGGIFSLTRAADSAKPAEAKPAPTTDKAPAAKTDYLLRPGDTISIDIVDDARASHEFKLPADGSIKPVYLGNAVKLSGLSIAGAADTLINAYQEEKIFTQPKITVTVKEYAEQHVYFVGEVNRPGAIVIPPEQQLSLVAAFSQAGGHTRIASRTCTITRLLPDGKSATLKMDLRAAVEDARKDIMLQENDVVSLGVSFVGNDWD